MKHTDSEEKLVSAAGAYAINTFGERIEKFLAGPRPTEYDPMMPKTLIDHVDLGDDTWTFHFHGGISIEVDAIKRQTYYDLGRSLKRSEGGEDK